MELRKQALVERFIAAGQSQVVRFIDELDAERADRLLSQMAEIDLSEIKALVAEHLRGPKADGPDIEGLEPSPYIAFPQNEVETRRWESARDAGIAVIRAGRVAAFTVAGGQGTRLGYDHPKGSFPISPVQNKTLFQIFAEKIVRSEERYEVRIPWFILTSAINRDETLAFFEANNYFGLSADSVYFIVQGLVPAVDREGRILLKDKGTIAMTPDGHGGALRALVRSGAIDRMKSIGVDTVSYFQVDNPIVQCIDPVFIGFHDLGGSELSSKMVRKAYPLEKVGHFCRQNGRLLVVEYSDMPVEMQESFDENGEIRFHAGSVAIHLFDRDFIERMGGDDSGARLPFHRADKKIPYITETGERMEPDAPNGIKFEMFVFDALPFAKNPVVIEAARCDDFSPVKNATGPDSPKTCREDQLRMFARWLRAAGEVVEVDESGLPAIRFEISPRFAVDQSDFLEQWAKLEPKPAIVDGCVIE